MNERFYIVASYVLGFVIYLLFLMAVTSLGFIEVFDFIGRMTISIGSAHLLSKYILNK